MKLSRQLRVAAFATTALVLFALSVACTQPNPATGKDDLVLISTAAEINIGIGVHNDLTTQMSVSRKAVPNKRFHTIGKRVARVSDRQDLTYRFTVLDESYPNAFAAPGGFIYATTDLMGMTDDDELACVTAHEIGHVAARHGVKNLQTGLAAQLFLVFLEKNSDSEELQLASAAAAQLLMLGYSRKYEYEADLLGLRYAWRAGYDPRGLVTFFAALKDHNKDQAALPEFLSTHPEMQKRIDRANQIIRREYMLPNGSLKPPPALPSEGAPVPVDVSSPS